MPVASSQVSGKRLYFFISPACFCTALAPYFFWMGRSNVPCYQSRKQTWGKDLSIQKLAHCNLFMVVQSLSSHTHWAAPIIAAIKSNWKVEFLVFQLLVYTSRRETSKPNVITEKTTFQKHCCLEISLVTPPITACVHTCMHPQKQKPPNLWQPLTACSKQLGQC